MEAVWEEQILPQLRASPAHVHEGILRRGLPQLVATYARRQEVDPAPLTAAARELKAAADAGVLDFDLLDAQRTYDMEVEPLLHETIVRLLDAVVALATTPGAIYPVFDDRADTVISALARHELVPTVTRVGIAQELVVSLQTFPMASMDVVLDVRERIRPSLARFRAALAQASDQLGQFDAAQGFGPAVEDLRARTIDPALQEIEENLEQLGARPTLLRGWPAAAAEALGLTAAAAVKAPELAQYVPLLAGMSTAYTKELLTRAELDRERRRNQFFFLHAAERYLAEGIEQEARGV